MLDPVPEGFERNRLDGFSVLIWHRRLENLIPFAIAVSTIETPQLPPPATRTQTLRESASRLPAPGCQSSIYCVRRSQDHGSVDLTTNWGNPSQLCFDLRISRRRPSQKTSFPPISKIIVIRSLSNTPCLAAS